MAEKESLYSQNRQTWGLLEERTQENNQLQVVLPALSPLCSLAECTHCL